MCRLLTAFFFIVNCFFSLGLVSLVRSFSMTSYDLLWFMWLVFLSFAIFAVFLANLSLYCFEIDIISRHLLFSVVVIWCLCEERDVYNLAYMYYGHELYQNGNHNQAVLVEKKKRIIREFVDYKFAKHFGFESSCVPRLDCLPASFRPLFLPALFDCGIMSLKFCRAYAIRNFVLRWDHLIYVSSVE